MHRARELARREEGMTIVEVMVAALILVLGSLAVLSLVSASARQNYRSEQSQVVSDRLQEEVERIEQLPYDQIALTALPADSTSTRNPSWRVAGTSYAIAQDGTQLRPLAYDGSALATGGAICDANHACGAVDPTPTHFTSGDVGGTIYRFVVWEDDPTCPPTSCPGSQDIKRVIVAIALDGSPAGGVRHYTELQSQATDPAVTPPDDQNPLPPGNDAQKPWMFWLTDTPCNNTTRQATSDHIVHNTNGACGNGLQDSSGCSGSTGCPPGAPDLMLTQAPPLTDESPLFDYATDIEPSQNPELDKGLQMPPPNEDGCLSSLFQPLTDSQGAQANDPDATRMQLIHKWLSRPMGSGFNVTLDGTGTLNLWTQSINGASYAGKICIWLFERHPNLLGIPVDTPAVNLDLSNASYFTWSQNPWPTGWTELHIPLNFNLSSTLGPSSQLGIAIQVEREGTTGGGLQFLYDEPSYDSRLEVKTQSQLPF